MSSAAARSYDEVPYDGNAFPQTHPDRLCTVARLLGLSPPPVEQARVLELGCGAAGNLLPMAATLPDARFLGVDLGGRMLALGERLRAAAGLDNVRLLQADIATLDLGEERFDYIVCHGVFSWVPAPVRARILQIARANLAPGGVAYISYNTYPGWHLRQAMREMMGYHARAFERPEQKVAEGRALVRFLADAVDKESDYGRLLTRELEGLEKAKDYYVFHEHLEEENQPFYLHQVAALAEAAGLSYLGEAEFHAMTGTELPPAVAETLRRVSGGSQVRMEQYKDFLQNRTFRQSLFVRAGSAIDWTVAPARLAGLHVACNAKAKVEGFVAATPDGRQPAVFEAPRGGSFTVHEAGFASALRDLTESWPASLPVEELSRRVGRPVEGDLLYLFSRGWCELRPRDLGLAAAVPTRPEATPLQRAQAMQAGMTVTSCRHESTPMNDLARHILALCDGTRDEAALLDALVGQAQRGVLTVRQDGAVVTDAEGQRRQFAPQLATMLREMTRLGFFRGPRPEGLAM